MNTPYARSSQRCSAAWGVSLGGLIAFFVLIPLAFSLQDMMDVPEINATPSHLRARPVEVASSYWLSWVIAFAVLLAPTLTLAVFPRTRRVAVGYALATSVVGGGLTAVVISFELGGFAPS
ncbi:hypothetical protein ACL02S_01490 [Nocardia sp. 004]|uniref:hypothetical protein n=1 Tax=Nocardia sp. 004 TaxID=3385978 RepID=UPI00399EFD0A